MRLGFMMGHDRERMRFAVEHGFRSAELMVDADKGSMFPGQDGWEDAVR